MSKITIKFFDENNNIHSLQYKLYKSGLVKKWLSILTRHQNSDKHIHSFFMNRTEKDFPFLIKEMNEISLKINETYDRKLPLFDNASFLNQDILNMLHEEYEIYGDRIDELTEHNQFTQNMHESFLRLNELIHACEIIFDNVNEEIYPMSVLFNYYPKVIHEWIDEIDKLYVTTSFHWGGLYLGYNTLGKDWFEISNHNDLDVILRNQVRPQKKLSDESWLYFSKDEINCKPMIKFEQWYNSLSDDVKGKVPVDWLNELTLGRFEIGSLVIDDYFLNYHDNKNDWMIPNHPIKNKWNLEVFSTFRKIDSILVHDSE